MNLKLCALLSSDPSSDLPEIQGFRLMCLSFLSLFI